MSGSHTPHNTFYSGLLSIHYRGWEVLS